MSYIQVYIQAIDKQIKLKRRYNEILGRVKELEQYIDNSGLPLAEREQKLSEWKALVEDLKALLGSIEHYTGEEMLEGFKYTLKGE